MARACHRLSTGAIRWRCIEWLSIAHRRSLLSRVPSRALPAYASRSCVGRVSAPPKGRSTDPWRCMLVDACRDVSEGPERASGRGGVRRPGEAPERAFCWISYSKSARASEGDFESMSVERSPRHALLLGLGCFCLFYYMKSKKSRKRDVCRRTAGVALRRNIRRV